MRRFIAAAFSSLFGVLAISNIAFCVEIAATDFLLAIPKSINFVPSDPVLLFSGNGTGHLTTLPSIPANPTTDLNDPIEATFSPTGELFIANRHSNVFNGVGSIARFNVDQFGNWTPNGIITGNSLEAPHGLAFSQSGELFAANLNNGLISRFTFDTNGNAVANGTIARAGTDLGVAFSPSGELFVSGGGPVIDRYIFDVNGVASPHGSFTVPGAQAIHFIDFDAHGELFVPDHALNSYIYRYTFDVNGNPIPNGSIFQPAGAIGVAFSPDGEMFATSQSLLSVGGGIYRFLFDSNGNAIPNGHILTDQLGGPAIFSSPIPEPSTLVLAALGLIGLAGWVWRRRKRRAVDCLAIMAP